MRLRKLLFPMFIHSSKGGMQKIVTDLILGLSKKGWQCTFITYTGTELFDELNAKGIDVIGIKTPHNIVSHFIFLFRFYKIIFSYKSPIIITNDIYTHILLSLYPYRKYEVFVSHGGDYKSKGTEFAAKTGASAKIARFTFKRVNKFIAVSESQKCALHQNAKVPDHKISIIYNGFNDNRIKPNDTKHDTTRISIIGYIKRLKNQGILFKTIKDLRQEGYNCELNLFGAIADLEYYNQLKKEAQTLGIEHEVHFNGFVTNKDFIYNNTDILVSCSYQEGFGLSIIEAMAYHIPTIAYAKSAGPSSIITNNITGILVDHNESNDYKKAILKYITDEPFRKKIIINASNIFKQKFSYKVMISNYNEFLLNIK